MKNEQELIDCLLRVLSPLGGVATERILQECIKTARVERYRDRTYDYPQAWLPVLREGYERYFVSNWGYVRHSCKSELDWLQPAPDHKYPRVAVPRIDGEKRGTKQHMVHELVVEAFVLRFALPKDQLKRGSTDIINHKDGDKWHPALHNLELTTQGENLRHAYNLGLR